MANNSAAAADVAESYYDSQDADEFYFRIWGGEDIHIGLYDHPDTPVREASRRTVLEMARLIPDLGRETQVLDLGAGYGGAARLLASRFGCRVTCLNLSETQNERNRQATRAAGLSHLVDVVHGRFEELPFSDGKYDVVWSQDALLHSGARERALEEVARTLSADGSFVFTDPMQADGCPPNVLGPVLERLQLTSLASPEFYRSRLSRLGFEDRGFVDMTEQLGRHYSRVQEELSRRYEEMVACASPTYVDRMLSGLSNWIDAQGKGYLAWGIMSFRRS